ncbi:MAG: class I SAM-dependent methyltransferase [Cycloclasticus pugetii]|jgi:SAM-dependent methyltransferase|uniref:class I SAM-dependent methyltransferase n=1 Tax=Cycloclasticus pugetii TaxID=34068 RepID=UPI003A90855B
MDDISAKETTTIKHYEHNADAFWSGTKDHDVSQNIKAFLAALPKDKTLNILDFGCGPGRDLKHFKSLGHVPIGLDGSPTFCKMATQYSGCPTLNQTFATMTLPFEHFDGVFANASMFHVPSSQLLNVLNKLHQCLRPNGILFTSNPRGNAEGWQGQRYGHYQELEGSKAFLEQAGFEILTHYYRPEGKPQEQQPWLAIVSRQIPR